MFKPGELARFKQWDDMEELYGLMWNGDIGCDGVFTKDMRPLCGEVVTIKSVSGNEIILTEDSDDYVEQLTGDVWMYSSDMFDPVEANFIADNVSAFWSE